MPFSRFVHRAAPIAALVVIAAIGLGFIVLHPEGLLNRHSDLLEEVLATQTVLHRTWQSAYALPLWRPDVLGGAPALTNTQSLYTHPFHALFAAFEPLRVVGLVAWLQMLLAALGAYLAGYVLRLSMPGRLMVAVAMLFSFKTILAVYAGWLTVPAGVASMPLLFATTVLVVERPSRRTILAAGGVGALALHSGHLQITYYTVVFLGLAVAIYVARLLRAGHVKAARTIILALTVSAAIAVGLSAYLLIPLWLDIPLITRGAASYEFFAGESPMPARALMSLLDPEFFGTPITGTFPESWEYVVYFGAAPTFLAIVGAAKNWHRPLVRFAVGGLALSILLSLHSPLLRMLYAVVPGYGLFRLPARLLFLSAFFACCLAGFGMDELRSAARTRRSRRAVGIFLIALVSIEGTWWAHRYLRVSQPIAMVQPAPYLDAIAPGAEPERVAPLSRFTPAYSTAAFRGLQFVTGYDGFNLRTYQQYMDMLEHGRTSASRSVVWTDVETIARFDMLAALNVKYLVSPTPVSLPASEYALQSAFENQPEFKFYAGEIAGPVFVYRNRRFLSRAFFVDDVRSVTGDTEMVQAVMAADVRTTAVAEGAAPGRSQSDPGDRVDVRQAGPGHLTLATSNRSRRFLVVSEVWHPGWAARVDGRPAALYRTDIALQGLWLEPGDHDVELSFWPRGLTAGLATTVATAAGMLATVMFALRQRRKRWA